MPKYLLQTRYTLEGLQGVLQKGGTARRQAVEQFVTSLGGKVEAYYYAFGDIDTYLIADLPDNITAAKVSLVASATGGLMVKVTVLLTPEEIDAATQNPPPFRPPGA